MKQIPGWQCSDGRCFFNQKDAETHETLIAVEHWLQDDPSFFHGGLAGVDDAKELMEFLERNEENILKLMGWRKRLRCKRSPAIGGGQHCTQCGVVVDYPDSPCPEDKQ